MARYYFLLIAFAQQPDAETGATLLRERTLRLSSGREVRCTVRVSTASADHHCWVYCEPQGVSLGAASTPWTESAAQLDEVAAQLYAALTDLQRFTCAIAGWEVADLFLPDADSGYADLRVEPRDFLSEGWSGLVISDSLWASLDRPTTFQPFCPGYVWLPYRSLSISGW